MTGESVGLIAGVVVAAVISLFCLIVCMAGCYFCTRETRACDRPCPLPRHTSHPRPSTTTTTRIAESMPQATPYPANIYNTHPQEPPPPDQPQQEPNSLPNDAILQEAPPPSYEQGIAYPPPLSVELDTPPYPPPSPPDYLMAS